LAEIGPGGTVSLNIPGMTETLDLASATPQALKDSLKKFQEDSKLSESDLQIAMKNAAEESLSVQKKMELSLDAIKNQGIKTLQEKGTGDVILENIEKQTLPSSANVAKVITTIDTEMAAITTHIETFFQGLSNVTSNIVTISNSIAELAASALKTTMITTPTPTTSGAIYATPTVSDAFIPAGGNSVVKTGFGQILPNVNDEMLFSPDISNFFAKYNESEKRLQEIGIPKSGDLSMMYKSANATPNTAITDFMSKMSNISTGPSEIKQTVEIGGKTEVTLNINTNIPQNLISQVLDASQLKETIMNTVNTRLSAEFSDKLSNALITQKRG